VAKKKKKETPASQTKNHNPASKGLDQRHPADRVSYSK
jgi:hypothetical protein